MKSSRSVLLTVIFGIIIGCLTLSLSLGKIFAHEVVYTYAVWIVFYPVTLLRSLDSRILFIGLYLVVWLYVFIKGVAIQRDAFTRTLVETVICMAVIAIPFVPFGIQYFSLLRYNFAIQSVYMRLLPFVGLFVVLLCSNFFYFEQRFSTAVIWTINVAMVIIFLITLADLLPLLSSQPFLSTLNYRISIINRIITHTPALGILLFVIFGILCTATLDAYFLTRAKRRSFFRRIVVPFSVTVMVMLFLVILQTDYMRYRQFDYSQGINTIYLTTFRNKQVLWFDARRVRLVSGDVRTLYPFGNFDIRDTLLSHAEQFKAMAIIEGLSYYRLTRMLSVLANGPRDTVMYNTLRKMIDGSTYKQSSLVADLGDHVRERYESDSAEISVTGSIRVNGTPLSRVDFFVNRYIVSTAEYSDRVWMAKTDARGRFHFTCYRGDSPLVQYFHVYFMLPDTLIGANVEYLKVSNIPGNFSTAGTYILDPIAITIRHADTTQNVRKLTLYPAEPLDSFAVYLPFVTDTIAFTVSGEVRRDGRYVPSDISVMTASGVGSDRAINNVRDKTRRWRLYGQADSIALECYINTDR
jgi:hypothetical protein